MSASTVQHLKIQPRDFTDSTRRKSKHPPSNSSVKFYFKSFILHSMQIPLSFMNVTWSYAAGSLAVTSVTKNTKFCLTVQGHHQKTRSIIYKNNLPRRNSKMNQSSSNCSCTENKSSVFTVND